MLFRLDVTHGRVDLGSEPRGDGVEEFGHDGAGDAICMFEDTAVDIEYVGVCY
jgi:hypothetical protein